MRYIFKKFTPTLYFFLLLWSPLFAKAQNNSACNLVNRPEFKDLVDYIVCIVDFSIIPFIIGLALVVFIYGIIQYVVNESDEGKREKGKQLMFWGIIGLTVMISVWGLVNILGNTFKLNTSIIPQVSPN